MHIRTAEPEDLSKIITLYKGVSRHEGGIARLEEEITEEYVENFLKKSLATGLIIIAENPDNADQLIGEIHAYKAGPKVFDHVLGDLTLVVHPDFQRKKIGRTLFTIFLEEIGRNRPDIGKVELIARESNTNAIDLYRSLGFKVEGRMEMRIRTSDCRYFADIPMGWQNPSFEL